MTKGDGAVEKDPGKLSDDAAFLRKLSPSSIVARAKGDLTKDPAARPRPVAPSGPQHARQTSKKRRPNPFLVAGAAFGLGTLLAKAIDWRGHAHPRR